MKIVTESLRGAFDLVDAIPVVAEVPSSNIVRLQFKGKQLTLSLTSTAIAVATVDTDKDLAKTLYVDRRMLKTFLGTAGDALEVFTKGKGFTLRSSGRRLQLQSLDKTSGYGDWVPDKGKVMLSTGIVEALPLLEKYVPDGPTVENLQAVRLMKGQGVAATDGLALVFCQDASVKQNLSIPPLLVPWVRKSGVHLYDEKTGVGVKNDYGVLYQSVLDAVRKSYPVSTISTLLEEVDKKPFVAEFRAEDLASCCAYFSRYLFSSSANRPCLEGHGSDGDTSVQVKLQLYGGEVDYRLTGVVCGTLNLGWDVRGLENWASYLAAKEQGAMVHCCELETVYGFTCDSEPFRSVLILSKSSYVQSQPEETEMGAPPTTEEEGYDLDDDVPF